MGPTPPAVRLGDSLVGNPTVLVDLLSALPADLDTLAWQRVSWPGYTPQPAVFELAKDLRPDAILFNTNVSFQIPPPGVPVVAFGISLYGQGVAIGLVTDGLGNGLGNFVGHLFLVIPTLFQNWVP